jgi:AcrR family transcriptional regulator
VDTKEKIFDCALKLFSEKGFDGVSIRNIANAVGIKESSIYNHFDGKKSIIDEVCKRFVDTLSVSRPPLSEVEKWLDHMRPRDVFKALITSYGRQIDPKISQMARTVFAEHFHNEMAKRIFIEEIIQNSSLYYAGVLDLCEKKEMIQNCDKEIVANLFNNAQITLCIQYMHCKSDEDFRKVTKMMMAGTDFLIGSLERMQLK